MKIKHKLLSDYQYTTPDKKIFLIKSGSIIEEYIYKLKGENIPFDKEIVDANPQIFNPIDWKAELLLFMKSEKISQPSQLSKKLIPFFEEMIMSSSIKSKDIRESDLEYKEMCLKDKEDDIEIRIKRAEKKDDELRLKLRSINEKELDLQDKLHELNEKEKNLDRNVLSDKDFESKYNELQYKIDFDLEDLSNREKKLEAKLETNMNEMIGIENDIKNIYNLSKSLSQYESLVNGHPFVSSIYQNLLKSLDLLKERINNIIC